MLSFVDLVGAKVANVSPKGSLDFLWRGLHQVIRDKFRPTGAHERNRHVCSRLVHDPPKRIGSQGGFDEVTIGLLDFPRQELPCANELLLYGTRGVPRKKLAGGETMRGGLCSSRHATSRRFFGWAARCRYQMESWRGGGFGRTRLSQFT